MCNFESNSCGLLSLNKEFFGRLPAIKLSNPEDRIVDHTLGSPEGHVLGWKTLEAKPKEKKLYQWLVLGSSNKPRCLTLWVNVNVWGLLYFRLDDNYLMKRFLINPKNVWHPFRFEIDPADKHRGFKIGFETKENFVSRYQIFVAIDDISLEMGECGLNFCDFESHCLWENDHSQIQYENTDQTLVTAKATTYWHYMLASRAQHPPADHTWNSPDRQFLQTSAGTAVYRSFPFWTGGQQSQFYCLSFFFYTDYEWKDVRLLVSRRNERPVTQLAFKMALPAVQKWTKFQHRLQFASSEDPTTHSDRTLHYLYLVVSEGRLSLSIDDLSLEEGQCENVGDAEHVTGELFQCNDPEHRTVLANKRCDQVCKVVISSD